MRTMKSTILPEKEGSFYNLFVIFTILDYDASRTKDALGSTGWDNQLFELVGNQIGFLSHAVRCVGFVQESIGFLIGFKLGSGLELLEHHLVIAKLLLNFGIGHMSCRQLIFELQCLLEGDCGFFVVLCFVVDKSKVVET